jgi:hypothetical protein
MSYSGRKGGETMIASKDLIIVVLATLHYINLVHDNTDRKFAFGGI